MSLFLQPMPKKANHNTRLLCSKLLCVLLALLVMNSSIDGPAASDKMRWNGDDYTEDLSFNEIETFYELITEEIMDLENFVPEHDNDADDTEKQNKSPQQLIAILPYQFQLKVQQYVKQYSPYYIDNLQTAIAENSTPPPDEIV